MAYDPETHVELSVKAASTEASSIDRVLKLELGLSGGVTTTFRGVARPGLRRVDELIGDGAFSEDTPAFRSLNHFHNPLIVPWDDAGLRAGSILGAALVRGQSSVLWQQNGDQPSTFVFTPVPLPSLGGMWSWQDARERYLAALTRPGREDTGTEHGRDGAFGELFEGLGHLAHLVQDAFVPAHARNDVHPPRIRSDWYEEWVEETRVARPDRFAALLSTAKVPDPAIFTATLSSRAPVPVARLIDADIFRSPADAAVLQDENPGIGAAEYTNGNFLSRGTLFRGFELPRAANLSAGPIVEETPGAFRRYFTKSRDGAAITHFVTEGMLFDALVAARAVPVPSAGWMLDDRVHEDYAETLLPRAVGYSAALLDYFFRGKLDVDLVDDGSGLRLVGTNASKDPLDGGTLTLYGDGSDGVRRPVSAATPVGRAQSGDTLPAVPVTLSEGAERFVAVYTGSLGEERSGGTFPGAVIGRVLGGVRVEEVFLDFDDDPPRWKLRTPRGIFLLTHPDSALPLTTADLEGMRWGDGEDQLVGRSTFGPGQPNRVVAYAVPRLPNSIEILAEDTPDGPVVQLRPIASWTLPPSGFPLSTAVSLDQTIEYRQQNVEYERTAVLEWTIPFPGAPGFYVPTAVELTSPRVRTLASRTVTFADTFAVVLDSVHHDLRQSPTEAATYSWRLMEVAVSTAGHLIGVVRVDHAPPPFFRWPRVAQPFYGLDRDGEQIVLEVCGPFACSPLTIPLMRSFPEGLLLWAVVDLTDGRVLAKTADDQITITGRGVGESPNWARPAQRPAPLVYRHNFERRQGNPDAPVGITDLGWSSEPLREWDEQAFATQTELALNFGGRETHRGWLRAELQAGLAQLGFLQVVPGQGPIDTILAFGDLGPTQMTLKVSTPPSAPIALAAALAEAVRARPTAGEDRLVFIGEGIVLGQGEFSGILVWDAPDGRATGLLSVPLGAEFERLFLGSATTQVAVVSDFARDAGYVVPLDGAGPPRFITDPDGLFFLRALAPRHLYDVRRERFARLRVRPNGIVLEATALPLVLQGGPGGPIGEYHAIRIP
jgi:hypothetical protein